jgi:hypothetical protein
MSKYHTECYETMMNITNIFPIEVELPACMLNCLTIDDDDDDDDQVDCDQDDNPAGSPKDNYSDQQQENANVKIDNLIGTF